MIFYLQHNVMLGFQFTVILRQSNNVMLLAKELIKWAVRAQFSPLFSPISPIFFRPGSFVYFDTLNRFSLLFTSLIWGGRLWAFSLVFKIKRKLFIKKSRTFPNHLDFTPSILFATKFYKMSLTEFRTELPIIWLSVFIRKLRCYALFKSRVQFRSCIRRWQFLLLLLLRMKMKTHLMRRTKIGKSKSLGFDCLASKPFRTITEKKPCECEPKAFRYVQNLSFFSQMVPCCPSSYSHITNNRSGYFPNTFLVKIA